jgi:hypothetical protein
MATVAENTKPKEIRLPMPKNGLAQWPTIAKVLKMLVEKLGFRLEIDGAESAEQTGDGLRFKLKPGEITGLHPFKGIPDGSDLICTGGFVNEFDLPDMEIDLGIVSAGNAFVLLEFTVDIEDGYVYGATLDNAELAYFFELPENVPSAGQFYVPLFKFNGQTVSQSARRDIRVKLCDNGYGTGTPELYIIQI